MTTLGVMMAMKSWVVICSKFAIFAVEMTTVRLIYSFAVKL